MQSDLDGHRAVGFNHMGGTLNVNTHMQGNGTYAQLLMENITSQ